MSEIIATTEYEGTTYEAHIDRQSAMADRVDIFRRDSDRLVHAGSGTWSGVRIEDCPAVLGGSQDAADEVFEALESELERLVANAPPALRAEELAGGWSVVDPDGGRWWPRDEARAEIETSEDPAATAARICSEQPMRGEWHS